MNYYKDITKSQLNLENMLFDKIGCSGRHGEKIVFIVGAPRVGSTFLYQVMINTFKLGYFSNFVNNHFGETPLLGLVKEREEGAQSVYQVNYSSQYGKTKGCYEPSEASSIMKNWFGGDHPSETMSSRFVSIEKECHLKKVIEGYNIISGRALVTKNPWNSFRIKALSTALPNSVFIWIRRSIEMSSISDLENRYKKGDPNKVWNSATTSNYQDIMRRPYWEQVVLQQYYYNKSIGSSFSNLSKDRYIELWYEDLCDMPYPSLKSIEKLLENNGIQFSEFEINAAEFERSKGQKDILNEDFARINTFINSSSDYMSHLRQ